MLVGSVKRLLLDSAVRRVALAFEIVIASCTAISLVRLALLVTRI